MRLAPCGLHCPEKSICVTLIRRPIPRTLSGLHSIRACLLSPQSPSTSKHRRVCNVISGLIMERHVRSTTCPPIRPGHAWFPLHRYTFPNGAELPCRGCAIVLQRASSTCVKFSRALAGCAPQFDCDDQLSFILSPPGSF